MTVDSQPSGPVAIAGHPNEIAGRYRVRRRIGEGGMGVVYECEHLLSKKRLAVKVLYPHLCHGAQAVERFRREVSAAAEIDHPGIVQVFDAGVDADGSFYMAMELLEGQSLAERIRERWPSTHEAVDLVRQVLVPLGRAHERGFVHRDLKPENLFLARDAASGRVVLKLLDFGLARDVARKGPTLTGITFGTPEYMSPEQSMSAKKAGLPSDVWSIGVLLYELLTGFHPFDGETPNAIMVAAIKDPLVPLAVRAPQVPAAVAAVVEACLEKEPERRPADARVVASLLETALADVTLADTRPQRTHLDVTREREEVEVREADEGRAERAAPLPRADAHGAKLERPVGQRGVTTQPIVVGASGAASPDRTLRRVAIATALLATLALVSGVALALRQVLTPRIDATPLPVATAPPGGTEALAPPTPPSSIVPAAGAPDGIEPALGIVPGAIEPALGVPTAIEPRPEGEPGGELEADVGADTASSGRSTSRRAEPEAAAPVATDELTDADYTQAQACIARGEASCAIAILRRSPRARDLARVVDLYESSGRTNESLTAMESFVRRFPRATESTRFRETLARHGR